MFGLRSVPCCLPQRRCIRSAPGAILTRHNLRAASCVRKLANGEAAAGGQSTERVEPGTLSKASTGPLLAAMNRSRSSRGKARNGAVFGSSNARRIAEKVDFAEPCSPESPGSTRAQSGLVPTSSAATARPRTSSSSPRSTARSRGDRRRGRTCPRSAIGSEGPASASTRSPARYASRDSDDDRPRRRDQRDAHGNIADQLGELLEPPDNVRAVPLGVV